MAGHERDRKPEEYDFALQVLNGLFILVLMIVLILTMAVTVVMMIVAIPFEIIFWLGNRIFPDPNTKPPPSPA